MRGLRSWLGLLGTLALAGLSTPAGAQPVGAEFQINTYTTSTQGAASVASDASGNFVVAWTSYAQDGSSWGIFGQRYDSAGGALGSEFQVNSYTANTQVYCSVASDASGNLVVAWNSGYQDGSGYGVFGQRYDSAGNALGDEFRVNSHSTGNQRFASVASDASGNFVVVWSSYRQPGSSYRIFGQRYDSAGGTLGSEFRVNSHTRLPQVVPSVASDASGNFVVVWHNLGEDGSGFGIFGQRYSSGGVAQGAEFRVNSYTTGNQRLSSVASDASGNFVVVWESYDQDGSSYGVFGQRYDSAGGALGSEFRVNSFTTDRQLDPSVASDASGNFVVVWQSRYQDGSGYGIFGQRYDSGGVAQGGEFRVNSYTPLYQQHPSVQAAGSNQFVVAWESLGQDGSGYGVFGQRFNFAGEASITVVSPNTNVKWRIGSDQRIKWTHNLGPEATFRIELDRDDDGEYEELIAAAAPVDSATKGSFAWTVTGPPSATARVRVSWTDDLSVSDASDVTFQIRPAALDRLGGSPRRFDEGAPSGGRPAKQNAPIAGVDEHEDGPGASRLSASFTCRRRSIQALGNQTFVCTSEGFPH